MFYMPTIVKQLTDAELRQKNRVFFDFDRQEMDGFWEVLHEYFSTAPISDDRKYWWSFFRWYTILTWQDLTRIEREVFEKIVVGRQVLMALILGFDVWNKIMSYLSIKGLDTEDRENLYVKIRAAFLNSGAIVGYGKGRQEIKINDLVKELKMINSRGRDSMVMAEFYEKIKNLLFPSNDNRLKEFIDTDFKAAVMKMVDLMDFFITVEPEDLPGVMDMFLHPELYPANATAASVSAKPITFTPTVPSMKETKEKPMISKTVKPSYVEIKKEIDLAFKKDAEGNFVDLDGLLNKLEETAKKYNDNKIAELYYFDEKSGKFQWGI